MIELKACMACGLEKPLSAFVKRSGGGRRGTCRTCLRGRKRNEAPPAEARAAEAQALMAAASASGSKRGAAARAAVEAAAASTDEEAGSAVAAAVPKPGRKRRRRKKKQADQRREDKQDEADVFVLGGTSGEPDEEPEEENQASPAQSAADSGHGPGLAAEISAITPKRKRNRRRRRKKQTELRRQDAPDAASETSASAPAGVASKASASAPAGMASKASASAPAGMPAGMASLANHSPKASPAANADEAPAAAGGAASAAAQAVERLVLSGASDLESEAASSRKRKRKRRRGRGKSAKRKPAAESAESAESASVRPPNRAIVPVKGNFSFKTSLLNDRGRGMIRLRGKRETGKRWSTEIPTDMAIRMVEEGAAGIIHPGLIHKLYTKADFRLLVLQRDDYICRYCGNFGDTIDHVMPKSKGGLSTPANCVCACAECNLKKADSLDYVDDDVLQQFL